MEQQTQTVTKSGISFNLHQMLAFAKSLIPLMNFMLYPWLAYNDFLTRFLMIILLHSTQMPENIGSVARIMGNFGLCELRLITPCINHLDPKAIAMSVGADAILNNAKIYDSLESATKDIHYLFGTCGDDNRLGIRHYVGPGRAFLDRPDHQEKVGVLFGCERTGLSQDDLSYCRATIHIPVDPSFSSMNLSHAVGIVAYEWFKAVNSPIEHEMKLGGTRPADQKQKQALFQHLVSLLDDTHYWRVPSKKPLMKQNLANLFFRMDLTEQEIQTLFGLFNALKKD